MSMSNQHMSALLWRAVELHITLLLLLSLLSFLLHNLLGVGGGAFWPRFTAECFLERRKQTSQAQQEIPPAVSPLNPIRGM